MCFKRNYYTVHKTAFYIYMQALCMYFQTFCPVYLCGQCNVVKLSFKTEDLPLVIPQKILYQKVTAGCAVTRY